MSQADELVARFQKGRGYVEEGWPIASRLDPDFVAASLELSSRAHLYEGYASEDCLLSMEDRELIATAMLAAQGRPYFAFNHVVRLDRVGADRELFLDAFLAAVPVTDLRTALYGLRCFMMADGLLEHPDPGTDVPISEADVTALREGHAASSPELRYGETHHPEFVARLRSLAQGAEQPASEGPVLPGFLDELLPAVILASRNHVAEASKLVKKAMDRGATPRHIMEAAESGAPMSGMPTILLTLRAMRMAETGT